MPLKLPKQVPAKLPLPPEEIARIKQNREMLANLMAKCNELALAIQQDAMAEIEARKAARAAAPQTPPQAKTPRPHTSKSKPAQPQAAEPTDTGAAETETRRRTPRHNPEAALFCLVRAITICMRTDDYFANRLVNGCTSAEQAALNHPARQPILDYLHKATNSYSPFQFQRSTHNDLETRITQELAWAPNRNPGDIIAQIATQYDLAHNPDDYPNNWRPSEFRPPPPEDFANPDLANPPVTIGEAYKIFMGGVITDLGKRGLL